MTKLRIALGQKQARPKRFYTILLVPHSRSRFRKLHVSRNFLLTAAAVGLLLSVAGLYSAPLWFEVRGHEATVARLAEENRDLRHERDRLEGSLSSISERLSSFENQARQLASALGVENPVADPAGGDSTLPGTPARSWVTEELGALDARSTHLEDSLGQLDEAFQARARLLAATPNIMPIDGWFSHGYGWRKDPFTGRRQFHRGIDIVNDKGTPVLATADGVVMRATRDAELGKTIDISHGHGLVTRYAHMSELVVRRGERVSRGDRIGAVGSTGRSTGPHLHYEVFRDGRRVNPWKYLGRQGG